MRFPRLHAPLEIMTSGVAAFPEHTSLVRAFLAALVDPDPTFTWFPAGYIPTRAGELRQRPHLA